MLYVVDTRYQIKLLLPQIGCADPLFSSAPAQHPLMPDDHSELVPPLPIPNRTVKRLHANDSADTRVKVGNRQAPHSLQLTAATQKPHPIKVGFLRFGLTLQIADS